MFLRQHPIVLPLSQLLSIIGASHSYEIPALDNRAGQLSCAEISNPTTFSIKGTTYVKVEGSDPMYQTLNSTQLAFEVVNNANGISVGCSLFNPMFNGQYPDDSKVWRDCQDKSVEVDGGQYPLTTNSNFIWDDWKLSVNQSWECDDAIVRHISTVTLSPTCTETKTPYQYINDCSAPDVEVPATSQ